MAQNIKIAPDLDEIQVSDTEIHTDWNGGITYKARLKDMRKFQGDEWLKDCFRAAIAFCGKPCKMETILNRHFHKRGHLE